MSSAIRAIISILIILGVISCSSPSPTITSTLPALPTDQYSRNDDFGDGYIANIKVEDVKNNGPEEIIKTLVTQWLEHYKTESTDPDTSLIDYSVDKISIIENMSDDTYIIVAGVSFSIYPKKFPNNFRSFPGEPYSPPWEHISAPFGVIHINDYYYLRLVFGWGT